MSPDEKIFSMFSSILRRKTPSLTAKIFSANNPPSDSIINSFINVTDGELLFCQLDFSLAAPSTSVILSTRGIIIDVPGGKEYIKFSSIFDLGLSISDAANVAIDLKLSENIVRQIYFHGLSEDYVALSSILLNRIRFLRSETTR